MFKPTEINFTIEGIKGELKLVYNIIGAPKLYQNGQPLKKEGLFKMKYLVETDDNIVRQDYLEIKRGLSFTFSAVYKGKETFLEEKLSTIEYIIGTAPIVIFTFLGGAIGAVIGLIATTLILTLCETKNELAFK